MERADRSRAEQERSRHDLVLESVESAVLCRDTGGCQNTFGCPVCVWGGGGGELHDKLTSLILQYHVLWGTHTASWPSLVAMLQGPGCRAWVHTDRLTPSSKISSSLVLVSSIP